MLPAQAQEPASSQAQPTTGESSSSSEARGGTEATQPPAEPPGGKRVFGVLPNYRTADASQMFMPITVKQKFTIASKDSFDYPLVLLAGALAGYGQLVNQNPSFGQGVKGYAHRLWTGYTDQALGNLMTEGIYPSLLREDPRYFRKGTGSKWGRVGYAASRIFVTRTDAGGTRFNYSEWVGNATAVAISNAYYPDNRTAVDNVTKLVEQCGIDAASQVLKEFWPDIKHKFFHGKQE
jgi:hypothetical protein